MRLSGELEREEKADAEREQIVDDTKSTQLGAELTVSLAMAFICIVCSQMWLVYRVHVVS